MTQSGQGGDPQNPAGGPAREGVVLPANGGEPYVPDQQSAPAAGQPWGEPWGPSQAPQQQGSYAPQQPGAYPPPPQGQPPVPPMPPEQPSYGAQPSYGTQASYGAQASYGEQPSYGAQPSYGEPQPSYGAPSPYAQQPQQSSYGEQNPYSGQAAYGAAPSPGYGYPQTPQTAQPPQPAAPQPVTDDRPGADEAGSATGGALVRAERQAGAPLPPAADEQSAGAGAPLPPQNAGQNAGPLPPASGDSEATQLIQPFAGGPAAQPMPAPQGPTASGPMPGSLPPENKRPESDAESTTMLRRPVMPQAPASPDGTEAATQLIPPVGGGTPQPPPGAPFAIRPGMPGDRPTPAEFDGLFRDGPGGAGAGAAEAESAGSTQQMPRFEPPAAPQGHGAPQGPGAQPGYGAQPGPGPQYPGSHAAQQPGGPAPQHSGFTPQGPYPPEGRSGHGGGHGGGGGRRRKLAPAAIIGAVVVVCVGAGLGVGYALSGSDDDAKKDGGKSSADTVKQGKPSPTADPAEVQAKELDALLKDSNNSRSAVIGAVANIKSCTKLGAAAKDLRDAAGQRNDLVTRLGKLSTDQLPDHIELTTALTNAWKSSAAADNHYATWADQVAHAGKKGCHKGKARGTKAAVAGNTASGQATTAKKEAAKLWNPIATKYGLTEHSPEQL
ncbi:hypothetical protein AB0I82_29980 [Streptomyces sp. NPDC050315]|uniref:hypothetical protein n=1 Tax=Streptomyces sp. NPDC050315 TaxID=3155039 RepID=UPI00342733D2